MTKPLLQDGFDHHLWATRTLIDSCMALTPDQLETSPTGTYGPIIETMRHLVAADCGYLYVLGGKQVEPVDTDGMDLQQLRDEMDSHAPHWAAILEAEPDPETVLVRERDDGSSTSAPIGIRLAQVVHHGTDHRSQICTALTSLGIEPPFIDAWDFGEQAGMVVDTQPNG
jgi:uncharacterized damage-inducible protein DinB